MKITVKPCIYRTSISVVYLYLVMAILIPASPVRADTKPQDLLFVQVLSVQEVNANSPELNLRLRVGIDETKMAIDLAWTLGVEGIEIGGFPLDHTTCRVEYITTATSGDIYSLVCPIPPTILSHLVSGTYAVDVEASAVNPETGKHIIISAARLPSFGRGGGFFIYDVTDPG